jgi:hypothetical protein
LAVALGFAGTACVEPEQAPAEEAPAQEAAPLNEEGPALPEPQPQVLPDLATIRIVEPEPDEEEGPVTWELSDDFMDRYLAWQTAVSDRNRLLAIADETPASDDDGALGMQIEALRGDGDAPDLKERFGFGEATEEQVQQLEELVEAMHDELRGIGAATSTDFVRRMATSGDRQERALADKVLAERALAARAHLDQVRTRFGNANVERVLKRAAGLQSLPDTYSMDCNGGPNCTPLVLSFTGARVGFGPAAGAAGRFDLSARQDGSGATTDWPTAVTPWLVLDRDGDGRISSGRELFGSATLVGAQPATNGFEALAAYDLNGDGRIDKDDAVFTKLALWSDANGDRVSAPSELHSLAATQIESIELGYAAVPRCDARGNCEVETARFTWVDASGRRQEGNVVDVHLGTGTAVR